MVPTTRIPAGPNLHVNRGRSRKLAVSHYLMRQTPPQRCRKSRKSLRKFLDDDIVLIIRNFLIINCIPLSNNYISLLDPFFSKSISKINKFSLLTWNSIQIRKTVKKNYIMTFLGRFIFGRKIDFAK